MKTTLIMAIRLMIIWLPGGLKPNHFHLQQRHNPPALMHLLCNVVIVVAVILYCNK